MRVSTNPAHMCLTVALGTVFIFISALAFSQAPTITSASPSAGDVGTAVSLAGTNFSTTLENNIVFFGATRATVSTATASELLVSVPVGATFGPITVVNLDNNLLAQTPADFTPTFSPQKGGITSLDFTKTDLTTAHITGGPLQAGDLDGDGLTDLLVGNASTADPFLSIFRNTSTSGNVTFATAVDIAATRSDLENISLADMNGDGKLDLVLAKIVAGKISVLMNTSTVGAISFATKVDFSTSFQVRDMAIADLDADGRSDIVLIAFTGGKYMYVMRNTSSVDAINFAAKVSYEVPEYTSLVEAADLDGDAKPELIAGTLSVIGNMAVFRNISTPGVLTFESKVDFPFGDDINTTGGISVADLDGDGRRDLTVIASMGENTISIRRNTSSVGALAFAPTVYFAAPGGSVLSAADLDGDGRPDLTVAQQSLKKVAVLRNISSVGSLNFEPLTVVGAVTFGPQSLVCADLDGDGRTDIASRQIGRTGLYLFRNFPLYVPVPAVATSVTQTSFQANWSATPEAVTYRLDVSTDQAFSSFVSGYQNLSVGNVTSKAVITNILPGVTYYYRLRASYAARTSGYSAAQAVVTIPSNPVATPATSITTNSFTANWALSAGATDYQLDISTTSDFSALVPGYDNLSIGVGNSYTATGLAEDETYYYRVRAENASGISAASNVVSLHTLANQTINFAAFSEQTYGDSPVTLTASASSGLEVMYSSSNQGAATISGNILTIVGAGTSTITASQDGDNSFAAALPVSQTLTVNKANQTITFSTMSEATFGQTPITLSGTASSQLEVSYSSSNTSVATINGNMLTIVGTGTAIITATQAGNDNYNAAEDVSQELIVNKATQTITFEALAERTFGDEDFELTATASSGLEITYTSSDNLVATVSGNTVTIIGAGTITITASQGGNGNYNAALPVSQTLTIARANQTISFGALQEKGVGNNDFDLFAEATSLLPVSFASSNTSVATISGKTVTVVGAGTTTITASQAGSHDYKPAESVDQVLTVLKADQGITFPLMPEKVFGDADFEITASASSSLTVTFTSSNLSVATISGNTVTIVGGGITQITASQAGDSNYNAAPDVIRSFSVAPAPQTITFDPIADKAVDAPAFAVTATSDAGLEVEFTTSTPDKVSVSGSIVTIISAGRATIEAKQEGNNNYAFATASQSFCIIPARPTIAATGENTPSVTLTSSSSTQNQWYLNGTEIAGATGSTYAAAEEGIYNVQTKVDDCPSELSVDYQLIVTGIRRLDESSINLYPNPVENTLVIIGIRGDLQSTLLYDATGRAQSLVLEKSDEVYRASVQHLSSGVYLLRVQEGGRLHQLKFVK